jgi:hypothetical protein
MSNFINLAVMRFSWSVESYGGGFNSQIFGKVGFEIIQKITRSINFDSVREKGENLTFLDSLSQLAPPPFLATRAMRTHRVL